MSRIRSLSALSALCILAAGLLAVGGSTPAAAAAGTATSAPSASYQVAINHGDGAVDTTTALAWTHEIVLPASPASGLPTGKRMHKPFVITKTVDKSSPTLLKACATGKHFPEVVITASRTRQGRSELYLTIKLEDAQITSFQTSGEGATGPSADTHELEHVQFTFQKITFDYRDLGVVFEDDMGDE